MFLTINPKLSFVKNKTWNHELDIRQSKFLNIMNQTMYMDESTIHINHVNYFRWNLFMKPKDIFWKSETVKLKQKTFKLMRVWTWAYQD